LEAITPNAYYYYPEDWGRLPAISYYEIDNRPETMADDREYTTGVEYVVDIWAKRIDQMLGLAERVDRELTAIGLIRSFTTELYEPETKIRHKPMRYRGVI
jgi:hypothetical protein